MKAYCYIAYYFLIPAYPLLPINAPVYDDAGLYDYSSTENKDVNISTTSTPELENTEVRPVRGGNEERGSTEITRNETHKKETTINPGHLASKNNSSKGVQGNENTTHEQNKKAEALERVEEGHTTEESEKVRDHDKGNTTGPEDDEGKHRTMQREDENTQDMQRKKEKRKENTLQRQHNETDVVGEVNEGKDEDRQYLEPKENESDSDMVNHTNITDADRKTGVHTGTQTMLSENAATVKGQNKKEGTDEKPNATQYGQPEQNDQHSNKDVKVEENNTTIVVEHNEGKKVGHGSLDGNQKEEKKEELEIQKNTQGDLHVESVDKQAFRITDANIESNATEKEPKEHTESKSATTPNWQVIESKAVC